MSISLLSTLSGSNLFHSVSNLRDRIATTSTEAVTGRYSDMTAHLEGRIGKGLLAEKAVLDIAADRDLLNTRAGRLDMVQSNLAMIQNISADIDTRALAAVGFGDTASVKLVARDARYALDQIFSALGSRHGERYLFSGDATATPPLAGADVMLDDLRTLAATASSAGDFQISVNNYFDDPAGTWATSIYSGSATSSDTDAVVANDPAITQIIKGLAALAVVGGLEFPSPLAENDELIEGAAKTISAGSDALISLRSDRGVIQERLTRELSGLDLEETQLTKIFNDLTARDQYEAATELKDLEASLEASYLLTSRLSNLSLLNFLR